MKIKKKDLRKGLAQLPINYPDPDVLPDAVPGGVLDMDAELIQVELLSKRLAHNEVVVRDAALAEVPRFLQRLTEPVAAMEQEFQGEMASVRQYFSAHPKAANPYRYDNIPLSLLEYRERAQEEARRLRRREAVRELRRQREAQKKAKANYGHYGAASEPDEESNGDSDRDDDAEEVDGSEVAAHGHGTRRQHKARYAEWIQTWADVELIMLKLSRGLHYCLWHSDKPLVQLACAQRIADLIRYPASTQCKVLLYGSLFRVLAREWSTIDRYRLDKYLALVRRMVQSWVLLIKEVAATSPDGAPAGAVDSSRSTPKATKKGKTSKRARAGESGESASAEALDGAGDLTPLPAANNSKGVAQRYVERFYGRQPAARQMLQEVFYILQTQIIPSTTSVGLTMHLCDVAFDELTKAVLPVSLFVTLAAGIPLYAMSQGNFVEKRVLDSFFPPLAAGVFAARRAEQLQESLQAAQRAVKKTARAGAKRTTEALREESEALAGRDNRELLLALAQCCQLFSVSRGTVRAVRVMFSEAELVLRQSADPESYGTLTRTAQRRRLEREIDEVDDTRARVRDERSAVREAKREERRGAIQEKVKARKQAMLAKKAAKGAAEADEGSAAAPEVDEKLIRKAVLAEEKADKMARKKAPRDTKRKKTYHLTEKDLYGEVASDDDED